MKQNALILVLLTACTVGWSGEPKPKNWLNNPSSVSTFQQRAAEIPETDFFEVRVTRLMTAIDRLKEKSAVALTEDLARSYVGPLYKAEQGKKPYLVRALFANYTGKHTLFWQDGNLLVRHDSLGHHLEPQFSPLVVNLPAEPKKVFVYVGGDE